jgi:hypothetical protein
MEILHKDYMRFGIWSCEVGTVSRLRDWWSVFRLPTEAKVSLPPKMFSPALGSTKPPIKWGKGRASVNKTDGTWKWTVTSIKCWSYEREELHPHLPTMPSWHAHLHVPPSQASIIPTKIADGCVCWQSWLVPSARLDVCKRSLELAGGNHMAVFNHGRYLSLQFDSFRKLNILGYF